MYWGGVPTNKFQDRDNPPDIFCDAAHRKFVKAVSQTQQYPDLYIWHIPKAVGKAKWVDYDERGFLVASGIIYPEYEELVQSIVKNAKGPLGMSHGVNAGAYKRDANEPNVIVEYFSHEFSLLPLSEAANLLTAFKV